MNINIGLFQEVKPHIFKKFVDYHDLNPEVYALFKKYALELRESGVNRYGVKAIFERVRWHFAVEVKGDKFKINNNYPSCYVRLLISEDPTFREFFSTRHTSGQVGSYSNALS